MMTAKYRIFALASLVPFLRSISAFTLTNKGKFPSNVSTLYSRREQQCSTSELPNRRDFLASSIFFGAAALTSFPSDAQSETISAENNLVEYVFALKGLNVRPPLKY
jgi:hypothetical protein